MQVDDVDGYGPSDIIGTAGKSKKTHKNLQYGNIWFLQDHVTL